MSGDDEVTEDVGLIARKAAVLARLKEKAEDHVRAALDLTEYCRRLNGQDGLSFREIADVLGVAHTSVFRAVERGLPLNVVTTASRRIGHQHELAAQAKARAGL